MQGRYDNWKGEREVRTFTPARLFFGSNQWHTKPQWLLEAMDEERKQMRTFALTGFERSIRLRIVRAVLCATMRRAHLWCLFRLRKFQSITP